jgi:lipocalin
VHNYATISAPNGTVYTIDGYAYIPDADEPGKLKVHFNSDDAAPFDAPYWILALGPVNSQKLYDWAIVSDNLASTLFILARNVKVFQEKYEDDVLAEVEEMGFTGVKKPIAIYQGSDCVYEADQRKAQIAHSAEVEKLYKETL